jgi:hypothetical protein
VWWSLDGKSAMFSSYGSFNDWVTETKQENKNESVTDLWSDPLLKGPFATEITDPYKLNELTDFMLKPESKLMSRGMEISSFEGFGRPQHDFYGNSLPVDGILVPGIHQAK